MADSLKVLMVGGRRAGKTSILAGLLDTMLHGDVKNIISIQDKTVLQAGQESLTDKIETLKQSINRLRDKTFLVDDSRTSAFTNYTIQISIPGTSNNMTIEFKDANGEFFESKSAYEGNISKQDIVDAVKEADIYIVAIDTPYLMEAANPHNELCTEGVNSSHNHIADVHTFLTAIDDKDGADAKMVIFAPVKCEKWAHSGQIDKVVKRVQEAYDIIFKSLNSYKNVEVNIIPVETVGAIEFKEHQTAYVCSNKRYTARKCCVINDDTELRFSNGECRPITNDDYIDEDPEARISKFHNIIRPYSWFHITRSEYKPKNCDQLAYYTLQFILSKYLFIKEAEKANEKKKNKSSWKYIVSAVLACFSWSAALLFFVAKTILDKMGTISLSQLETVVSSLRQKGKIKQGVDGIVNVKRSLLKH